MQILNKSSGDKDTSDQEQLESPTLGAARSQQKNSEMTLDKHYVAPEKPSETSTIKKEEDDPSSSQPPAKQSTQKSNQLLPSSNPTPAFANYSMPLKFLRKPVDSQYGHSSLNDGESDSDSDDQEDYKEGHNVKDILQKSTQSEGDDKVDNELNKDPSLQAIVDKERRRISSMVEMTADGDVTRINDIVRRYKGPEYDK